MVSKRQEKHLNSQNVNQKTGNLPVFLFLSKVFGKILLCLCYNFIMMKNFDVLIIGGGVAGMTAAIYAKRRGKKTAIIEKFTLGGQVLSLTRIENFPSQAEIDGFSLGQMFAQQIKHLEVDVFSDEIQKVDFSGEDKILFGKNEVYAAKSVIIATGLSSVQLGKNEDDFLGRGVSYCAVCDANFYKNKDVCVASKRGSGIKAALELSELCSSVTVLDSADMSKFSNANKNPKIKIVSNAKIEKVVGEQSIEQIVFDLNGKENKLKTSALFVELGKKPKTDLFKGILELDDKGFIKTDANMQTSVKNVFAVGDVRSAFLKQIVTACSDGAIAGQLA